MNGMDVTPEELKQTAEEVRDVKARYEAVYNAMYEELNNNMGPAGSGKMWHGNRAAQTLADAEARKDTFEAVSRLLEQAAGNMDTHADTWNSFDA